MANTTPTGRAPLVPTGIEGLDDILGGGFPPTASTWSRATRARARRRWPCSSCSKGRGGASRVCTSPSRRPRRSCAPSPPRTAGRSTASPSVELVPAEESLQPDEQYTMFHPSEVELPETTKAILAEVERVKPTRVVFDSLSEMRLLAQNPLRYRRQILALKQFFAGRQCTVLLLDDLTVRARRPAAPEHRPRRGQPGAARARSTGPSGGGCGCVKIRGMPVPRRLPRLRHRPGGLEVFPRLVAAEHQRAVRRRRSCRAASRAWTPCSAAGWTAAPARCSSARPGRASRRSPSQYAVAAAERGERAAIFTFDESARARCWRARPAWASGSRSTIDGRADPRPAGRPGRAVAGRVRPRDPRRRSNGRGRGSSSSTASTAT